MLRDTSHVSLWELIVRRRGGTAHSHSFGRQSRPEAPITPKSTIGDIVECTQPAAETPRRPVCIFSIVKAVVAEPLARDRVAQSARCLQQRSAASL